MQIPKNGVPREQLFETMGSYHTGDMDWRSGRCWAYVYDPGPEAEAVIPDPTRRSVQALTSPAIGRGGAAGTTPPGGRAAGPCDRRGPAVSRNSYRPHCWKTVPMSEWRTVSARAPLRREMDPSSM